MDQQRYMPQKLLNRDFILLWQGQTVSQLGTQAFTIALLFWTKHATESASLMGLLLMVSTLPAVFLGPIGGTVADHYSRRKIIIVCDTCSGVAVLSLAAVMFLSDNVPFTVGMLFAVSLILAIVSTFFSPAISAAIPALVPQEKLATANSLTQMTYQFAIFFGQAIGGTLFRILGAPVLFLLDGASYLFSAFSESLITIPQAIPDRSPDWRAALVQFKEDTMAGLRYVWQQSGLRELVAISAVLNFFMAPILLLMPFYVEDFLRLSPDWYGYFVASYGLGSVLGFLLAGAVQFGPQTRARLMTLFLVVEPLGYIVLGLVQTPFAALAAIIAGGIMSGYVLVNITTILQASTPEAMRGRVFGLLGTIAAALSPLGMGLAGVIADLTDQNVSLIYIGCGILAMILSLLILTRPALQLYLAYEPAQEPASAGLG